MKLSDSTNDSHLLSVVQIVASVSNKQALIVDDIDDALMGYRESSMRWITILRKFCDGNGAPRHVGANVDSKLFQNWFLLAYQEVVWLELYEHFVDILG